MSKHAEYINSFFEDGYDLFSVIDEKGEFVLVNNSWLKTLGYKKEELIGQNYTKFLHPEDLEKSVQEHEEFKQDDYVQNKFKNRMMTKSGEYLWLEWSGNLINGMTFASARECSVSHEFEQRLNLALDVVRMGIWDWDIKSGTLTWDDRMFELFEVDKTNATNDFEMWKRCVHPEDIEQSINDVNSAIENKSTFRSEFRIICNGKVKYLSGLAHLFCDDEGEPERMLGANFNITEEKLLEQENLKQKEIVEHQSRLALLGELSAGVGHEINNPLSILIGFNDLLENKINEGDVSKEDLLFYLGKQKEAANRIQNITDELRTFSRFESGESQEICLEEHLENMFIFMGNMLSENKVNIVKDIQTEKTNIFVLKEKLNQILFNLVSNSIDAIENNETKEICIKTLYKKDRVYIYIEDNGPGIPQDNQEHIFKPFFTTKKCGKGTGLGLSLSATFADLINGQLFLEKSDASGTSFGLSLLVHEKSSK